MTKPSQSFSMQIPPGDDRERRVCNACDFVDYVNPKIVAGSVVVHEDKILLCRRAIEPRRNFWTLPAGFMELNETVEEAAQREAREEACADIAIDALLAVYSIPRISQVQLMFLAHLNAPNIDVGPESLEVGLFAWNDIPWDELAFPSVKWALENYQSIKDKPDGFVPFSNPEGVDFMVR